jgi:hypothetical protein
MSFNSVKRHSDFKAAFSGDTTMDSGGVVVKTLELSADASLPFGTLLKLGTDKDVQVKPVANGDSFQDGAQPFGLLSEDKGRPAGDYTDGELVNCAVGPGKIVFIEVGGTATAGEIPRYNTNTKLWSSIHLTGTLGANEVKVFEYKWLSSAASGSVAQLQINNPIVVSRSY